MKWLEVIKVRVVGNRLDFMEKELPSMTLGLPRDGLTGMQVYRHAALDSDLSIHLCWESPRILDGGSSLGLLLARSLKEYGLVDHSVWIEGNRSFSE
jgi:hypothetical protein